MVEMYDQMQRRLRDKGWIETPAIIKGGIDHGHVLEIGPGPGYLGLEWLARTSNTTLTGVEISSAMIDVAKKNAVQYGFNERTTYVQGNGADLPFPAETFDGIMTASSLHEWENPVRALEEIWRVLKPGGRMIVLDFRRDVSLIIKGFLWLAAKPKEMRPGLLTSIAAAYTPSELKSLLPSFMTSYCQVIGTAMGLTIAGTKPLQ